MTTEDVHTPFRPTWSVGEVSAAVSRNSLLWKKTNKCVYKNQSRSGVWSCGHLITKKSNSWEGKNALADRSDRTARPRGPRQSCNRPRCNHHSPLDSIHTRKTCRPPSMLVFCASAVTSYVEVKRYPLSPFPHPLHPHPSRHPPQRSAPRASSSSRRAVCRPSRRQHAAAP